MTVSKKATKENRGGQRFFQKMLLFFVFEMIFTAISMPVLVFYGPFQNVKRTVVGASIYSLSHQYIARTFLSDAAITRILGESYTEDPMQYGGKIKLLNFLNHHENKIECYNIDGGKFKGKLMIVHDPSRIQVGYSSQMPKAGETTSSIAKRMGAVAAMNAGGFMDVQWAGTGGAPMGFIIHEGKVIFNQAKNETKKQDTAAFTKEGMLIVGRHSIKELKEYGVKEGVSFGPPLVVNERGMVKGDGGWGIAPRTAIGQRADGAVVLVTIDGRSLHSFGATLKDVQDIMLKYKAVNAVNLDGGSSTTMYLNGKVINTPSDALGERAVPSGFIVTKGGS